MKLWEGKRYVLLTAFILNILSAILLFVAYVTPYWYISWPRVYSGFRRIGLWEVCFYGMLLPRDPSQKSYYGCWWVLAPELQNIRDWVMPPWFIVVQILMTISLLIEIINLIIVLLVWLRTGSYDKSGIGQRRVPFSFVQAATIITIVTSVLKVISIIMFGLGAEFDINWMPNPEINYPHVSYGLAILSAFFTIFASMAHQVFRGIIRREYLQPSVQQSSRIRAPYDL